MNEGTDPTPSPKSYSAWALVVAGAVGMSYGWGFRGDYGHECGAMVPGALLGMAVCLCSGREDWFRRTALAGWLGAIGWGIGGQVSYGMIPSYDISDSFPDVYYGYGCLFIVGALWGGIGASVLSFAFTKPRSELRGMVAPTFAIGAFWCFTGLLFWAPEHLAVVYGIEPLERLEQLAQAGTSAPLWLSLAGSLESLATGFDDFTVDRMHDVDWLGATSALAIALLFGAIRPKTKKACGVIALMALGWWVGYLVLVRVFDLHMQPKPGGAQRSDNWAGMTGVLVALAIHLWRTQNRAGLMLAAYGFIGGGLGFSLGDFANKPDKVKWPPFVEMEFLQRFDHWKWTEQGFGLIMGAIVSLGVLRILRNNLAAPIEDEGEAGVEKKGITTNELSLIGLLGITFWWNFILNSRNLFENKRITHETLFGLTSPTWIFFFGCAYVALLVYFLLRNRREPLAILPASWLGKGQVLFLFFLWTTVVAVVTKAWPLTSRGALFVHGSFMVSAAICSWVVLTRPNRAAPPSAAGPSPEDPVWRIAPLRCVVWPLVCALLIAAISAITMSMQDGPAAGFRYRFGPEADHLRVVEEKP